MSRTLLLRLDQLAALVSSHDMYHCLRSLADSGILITFKSGRVSELPHIVTSIPKILREVKKEYLGSLLTILGKLGMQWADVTEEIRVAILESLDKHCSSMPLADLSFVLHGLTCCKVSWIFLSPSVKDKVMNAITSQIAKSRPLDLPLLLQPMSKLGVRCDAMSSECADSLLQAAMTSMGKISPQGVSQVLVSMTRIGLRPFVETNTIITTDETMRAYKAIENAVSSMTPFELCSSLQALSMGCKVDGKGKAKLPPPLVQAFYSATEKEAARLSAQNIQTVLISMYAMGVKWINLPASLQTSLLVAIQREGRSLYPIPFVDLLYSLKVLKVQLGSGKTHIEKGIWTILLADFEKHLLLLSFPHVCTALVAIAELGCVYATLPFSLKKALEVYLEREFLSGEGKIDGKLIEVAKVGTDIVDNPLIKGVNDGKNRDEDLEDKLRRLLTTLVEMKAQYSDFSPNLKHIVCESIKRGSFNQGRVGKLPDHVPSSSLSPHYSSSFSSLGIAWGSLDKETKIALQRSISNSLQCSTPLQAKRHLSALVLMEAGPWGSFLPELMTSIVNRVDKILIESLSSSTNGGGRLTASELALVLSYLFRLQIHWTDLSPNLKSSLQALLSEQPPRGGKSLPSVLNSLGRMGMRWNSLLPQAKHELMKAMEDLENWSQNETASVLDGHNDIKGDREAEARRAKESNDNEEFVPSSLANLFFGLTAMNVRYPILPHKVRALLKTLAIDNLPKTTTTQYSNILNSMGKMELTVGKRTKVANERLSEDTQHDEDNEEANDEDKGKDLSLKDVLVKEISWRLEGNQKQEKPMNEQHLSNVIFAMGSIGVAWQDLSPETRSKVGEAICRLLPPSDQATPDDFAPLPTTKYYSRISRDVKLGQGGGKGVDGGTRMVSIRKNWGREYFGTQGLSMLLVGLSRMGALWVELPLIVRSGLLNAVAQLLPEMRPPHISLTCLGINELQLFWKQIGEDVTAPLLNALHRLTEPASSTQSSLPDLSFALVSLGKVGLTSDWIRTYHPTLLDGIIRGMVQLMRVGSGGETAGGLEALVSLDISYSSLPREAQLAIQDAIKRICPLPPVPLTSCPSPVLCSLMYSVSLLLYDTPPEKLDEGIRSVFATLLARAKELLSKGVDLTKAERERMGQLFTCLRVFFPALASPTLPRLPPLLLDRKDGGLVVPSKLQMSVVRALYTSLQGGKRLDQRSVERQSGDVEECFESKEDNDQTSCLSDVVEDADNEDFNLLRWGQGVSLREEFIGFQDEVFPVDIAVFRKGKLVALIETDGPVHYDSQGNLRRGDVMKEMLYKKSYPGVLFVRVRYEQVDKFGSQAIGKQLAKYLYFHLQDDVE
ncbi:hypothetical protein EON65_05235 [archaeon]|nr:MAG: hypothetical protein EON65_05235 [archaeon]